MKPNGWTSDRRAKQAAAITTWRPWEQPTGPRTAAGKARSSRNAFRGGFRPVWRQVSKLLSEELRQRQEHRTADPGKTRRSESPL